MSRPTRSLSMAGRTAGGISWSYAASSLRLGKRQGRNNRPCLPCGKTAARRRAHGSRALPGAEFARRPAAGLKWMAKRRPDNDLYRLFRLGRLSGAGIFFL